MNPVRLFEIVISFTVLALLTAYLIPADSPLVVFRYFFGFVFVAVIPGYCLVSFLFPEGKLDLIEKTVLSVALSFGIAGTSGLFLGLTGFFAFNPIILTLSVIVLVLASLTIIRRRSIEKKQATTASRAEP